MGSTAQHQLGHSTAAKHLETKREKKQVYCGSQDYVGIPKNYLQCQDDDLRDELFNVIIAFLDLFLRAPFELCC